MTYHTLAEYRLTRQEVCLVIRNLPIVLAEKIINLNSYECRFAARDGECFAITSDIRSDRITVTAMAGVVIDAHAY